MKLNKEEICVGALVGCAFFWYLKWLSLITIPLCAFLWALGGAENTSLLWRRVGVTVTLLTALFVSMLGHHSIVKLLPLILCSGVFYGSTTIGYGIPDEGDAGSALGRLMFKMARGNAVMADILTRGTIGLAMALSWLYLAFLGGFTGSIIAILLLTAGFPAIVLLV